MDRNPGSIGHIIKELRSEAEMSVRRPATESGMPLSHLEWIEEDRRPPSVGALCRIAPPLGVSELDLLTIAGYVPSSRRASSGNPRKGRLDPHVIAVLAQQPIEVQRTVISVFMALKYMAREMPCEDADASPACKRRGLVGQPA